MIHPEEGSSCASKNNEPVRATVAKMLRDAISTGGLLPGARLSERKLCASLGVSRSALREAVRQLESDELLETVPQRGTFVASPTLSDALDIYEVRIELEGLAGRLAAALRDERALAALSDALDAIAAATRGGAVSDIVAAKTLFYERLVAASGNAVLQRSLARLRDRIELYRGVALNEPGRATGALRELRAIHSAIADGDAAQAERMSRLHIAEAARNLSNALSRKERRAITPVERAQLDFLGVFERGGPLDQTTSQKDPTNEG